MNHLISVWLLLGCLLLASCTSKERERFDSISTQIDQVNISAEAVDEAEIRIVMSLIDRFQLDYPESEYSDYLTAKKRELEVLLVHASYLTLKKEYARVLEYEYTTTALAEYQRVIDLFNSSQGLKLREEYPDLNDCLAKLESDRFYLQKMETFLGQEYGSMGDFNMEVLAATQTYHHQGKNIGKIWDKAVEYRRYELAKQLILKNVKNFETYLKDDAKKICLNDYENFDVQRVEVVSIGSPTEMEKYLGYECEGIFRVYLVGSFIGWDKGSVKIFVKGRITARNNGDSDLITDVTYSRTDYSIIEKSGL